MQVSSSLGIFLTTDLESWSPKIFERGRTPGHVQQWSDGRFKCQVVGSPALPHTRIVGRTRRSEILHQPPAFLVVPAAPVCFLLHKTQRLRYCYSQKNPVPPYPICLVRKHVENDSKNQTQKNMQLVLHFCTPHCLFLLTGSAVVRTDASQDTRYAPCTERVTVCHAPQAGVTSEANKK